SRTQGGRARSGACRRRPWSRVIRELRWDSRLWRCVPPDGAIATTSARRIPSRRDAAPPRQALFEDFLVLRVADRLLARDDAALDHVLQALVERLHAVLAAGLDRRIHLRDLVLADQVADGRDADHDLVRRDAAAADLLEQGLRNHRAQ